MSGHTREKRIYPEPIQNGSLEAYGMALRHAVRPRPQHQWPHRFHAKCGTSNREISPWLVSRTTFLPQTSGQ